MIEYNLLDDVFELSTTEFSVSLMYGFVAEVECAGLPKRYFPK